MHLFIKHFLIIVKKNTVLGLGTRDEKNGLNSQGPQSCRYLLRQRDLCTYFHMSLRISLSASRKSLDLIFIKTV